MKKYLRGITQAIPLEKDFSDYDEYWSNRGFDAAHEPLLARARVISKYIEPNATILDIGCGNGTFLKYIRDNNQPKHIVGIDISSKSVEHVKSLGVDAYQIDITSSQLKDFLEGKTFDYIVIAELLEHIQNAEDIVLAIKGHVKKNVFITIPNTGYFEHRLRLLFGKFPVVMIQQHIKEHIRFWTVNDFKYWSNFLGFTVEEVIGYKGFSIKPLQFLHRKFPSFFARQVIYRVRAK